MSYSRGYDDGYGGGYRSRRGGDYYDDDDDFYGEELYPSRGRDRGGDRYDSRDRRSDGFGRRDSGGRDRNGGRRDSRRDSKGGSGGGGRFGGGGMKRSADSRGDDGGRFKKFKPVSEDNWEKSDRHSLMQSHFLDSVPEQFEEDWLCIVRPMGKRRILVAANNITQSYRGKGEPDQKFKSCLPNGNEVADELDKFNDLTVLDTVYCPNKKCYYIVDILHWKHYPYSDTEAEFRFFVLHEKYSQLTTPLEVTPNNECPLILLEKIPCTITSIEDALKAADYKVEGLVFIQKKSSYVNTDSQQSLLLKLDQMEKVLEISVPEGVNFAKTDAEDDKWRAELEERKKLREARKAAKVDGDKKDEGKKSSREDGDRKDDGKEERKGGSSDDVRAHSGYFYD